MKKKIKIAAAYRIDPVGMGESYVKSVSGYDEVYIPAGARLFDVKILGFDIVDDAITMSEAEAHKLSSAIIAAIGETVRCPECGFEHTPSHTPAKQHLIKADRKLRALFKQNPTRSS